MTGRLENKIKTERQIQVKLNSYPIFITEFYYSLNSKTHMTKLRYINNVLRFLNWKFGDDADKIEAEDIKKILAFDIERYIEGINYIEVGANTKEMENASKAVILSSLSTFFDFMKANEYIEKSPFDNKRIERPKQKQNDVVFLTPDEVNAVEQSILDRPNTDRWKWRDLLLFRIPVINGLRVTALSEINLDDVNFKNHTITVVEKGDVKKSVYIDDQTIKYISYWMAQRRRIMDQRDFDSDALFVSSSNQRITVRSIERIITKMTAKAVPGKHITPHKLRSTLGVNMYQATKDIYLVAEVLGHRSTEPTRRYTKVFNEDKKNAINMMAEIYKNKA